MAEPSKIEVHTPFPDPLSTLIDICGSISPPSYQELKSMLENYKVVEGAFWFSVFVQKWSDFYHLPELLKNVTEEYSIEHPDLSNLCSPALDDIANCQQLIESAIEEKPDGPSEQSLQLEALYDLKTNDIHKRLTRICKQLNNGGLNSQVQLSPILFCYPVNFFRS